MNDVSVIKYDNILDIAQILSEISIFPFEENFLNCVNKANEVPIDYYLIRKGNELGIFIVYGIKLNVLTFCGLKLNYSIKVMGIPCSIASKGYWGETLSREIFEFARNMKGPKLILNCDKEEKFEGFTVGRTLPNSIMAVRWSSIDDYLKSLRSNYRYRINKALKNTKEITIEPIDPQSFTKEMYGLYINVFERSKYKLEKLKIDFFKRVQGKILTFNLKGHCVGFVQLFEKDDELVFLFCGMDYSIGKTSELYFLMIFQIVKYAIANEFKKIEFGQTSEETKLRIGAELVEKYLYINHSNKFLNWLFSKLIGFVQYNDKVSEFNPFKKVGMV